MKGYPFKGFSVIYTLVWMKALGEVDTGNPLQYFCLEIPGTEEPGGLQSMGSQKVRQDWRGLVGMPVNEGSETRLI